MKRMTLEKINGTTIMRDSAHLQYLAIGFLIKTALNGHPNIHYWDFNYMLEKFVMVLSSLDTHSLKAL